MTENKKLFSEWKGFVVFSMFLTKNGCTALDKRPKRGYIKIYQGANVAQLVEQFTRNE